MLVRRTLSFNEIEEAASRTDVEEGSPSRVETLEKGSPSAGVEVSSSSGAQEEEPDPKQLMVNSKSQ